MTVEENKKIVEKEVKDFFEGVIAKRHPPPEEKVDPVKAKRTIDALRNHQSLRRKPTMSALLKRHISKRSGREVLSVIKG